MILYSISAYGQTEQKDSLQIHADDDIKLNEEAVRSIVFDFAPHNKSDMKISMDKPWMEFSTDLPKEYIRKTIPKMEMKLKLDLTIPYIVSTSAIGFDADKLLYETLTERGRNIRRNRKHAKAWKIYNDYFNTIESAKRKGHAEGRAEGRVEEKFENARNLKRLGVSADIIMKATGLSLEEVDGLDF